MVLLFGLCISVNPNLISTYSPESEAYAAEIPSSTASMSIASPTLSNASSGGSTPNSIAYLSTNVTINASYIQSYSLTIFGNPNLVSPSNSSSTITGAGGKTPANMSNNTWGYNWGNTGTTESSLTYNSLSASGTSLTLDTLNSTTGSANFTKKLTFAVKFGSADAGHYTSDVTLSFTANPKTLIGYSVSYNVNGGLGGPNSYSEQSYDTSKSYTIPSTPLPTRDGYTFLGWSIDPNATSADANYAPGKTITLTQASPTRSLYAVWERQIFNGITNMQQMTTAICSSAVIGDSKTLTDTRDNSTYTVAKLADGKCWMTQNLRITRESIKAKNSSNTTGTITSTDSNVGTTTATGNNYQIPASAVWSAPSSSNNYKTQEGAYYNSDTDYGAYYSYYTATAGTTGSMTSDTASYDICPKGWRLPTGGESGEFRALYDKNTAASAWVTAANSPIGKSGRWLGATTTSNGGAFFPAASYVDGSLGMIGFSSNYYWSNTIYSNTYAYLVNFNSSNIYLASGNNRYLGCPVRCISKE